MDYEDIGNLSNLTFDKDITPEDSKNFIVHEIVFTLICVVAICANSFIIHIIFHYKRMRTVQNIILANWAIADIGFLILVPSTYRVISILDHIPLSPEFMCFLTHAATSLHLTNLIFTLIVAIDWCLAAYLQKLSEKFRYYYKFLIALIWIFTLLTLSTTTGFCIAHNFRHVINPSVFFYSYITVFLFVITLHCLRTVQKCRGRPLDYPPLMLTVVSSCALCWFLGLVGLFLLAFMNVSRPMLEIIGACAVFCTSIVTFVILYRQNQDFQACFLQLIKRSSNKYEEADFVFDSSIVKPAAQISFNKSQELLTDIC